MVVDVIDDGPGVAPEIRGRIFEPYTTTRKIGEGMGLGLAISKKIMIDHGGDLDLLDDAKRSVIPADTPRDRTHDRAAADPPRRGQREDRREHDDATARRRFRGQPRPQRRKALDAMREPNEPPDLLLLDVRLGGMSGIDLIRVLTNENRLSPTVIISGEASIAETVEALRLGVYDFIEKPFTRERLLQSIHNCLENTSLKRQLSALNSQVARGAR